MADFRFKRPKNGSFYHYCGDCKFYHFGRQVGCAFLGFCRYPHTEPQERDAYDLPCGLWTAKRKETKNG